MIARKIWPLLLATGVAQAATLPLKAGTYVLDGVRCEEPPFAATFAYDGHQFAYPHASKCRSTIVSQQSSLYHVRETCAALGDGSAAQPSTTNTAYDILSPVRVKVRREGENGAPVYRRCSPPH